MSESNMSIFDFLPPEPQRADDSISAWCKTCIFSEEDGCSFYGDRERSCNEESWYYDPDFKKFERFDDVVLYISNKTGVPFRFNSWELRGDVFDEWYGRKGKVEFDIHPSQYSDSDIPFISLGWKVNGSSFYGGGQPCDSIAEVIRSIEHKVRVYSK